MMSIPSIICFRALENCKNANGDSLLQLWGMTLATMGIHENNNGDSLEFVPNKIIVNPLC